MDLKSMIIGGVVGALSSTGFFALNVSAQASSPANQIVSLQKRCNGIVERAEQLANVVNVQAFRINDIERKVEGMQKQITILHAKKVNK